MARTRAFSCLLDTNVVLDYLLKREPWYDDSRKIWNYIFDFELNGFISAKQACDVHYICRKEFGDKGAKEKLMQLWPRIDIVNSSSADIFWGLQGKYADEYPDFEDFLLSECAISQAADYIITRDPKHFKKSKIKVITPSDFVQKIGPTIPDIWA